MHLLLKVGFVVLAIQCVTSALTPSEVAKFVTFFEKGLVQVCSDWHRPLKLDLLKQISILGKSSCFANLDSCAQRYSDDHSLLVIVDDNSKLNGIFNARPIGKVKPVLVVQYNDSQSYFNISVDQRVFFINLVDNKVTEKYLVNNVNESLTLGHIMELDKGKMSLHYFAGVSSDFFVRRKNFHGLHLKAMTDASGPNIRLNASYLQDAPYFKSNDTYEVTTFISGVYFDVWKVIEEELNITASFYKRRITAWASVSKDGKSINGMADDLLRNRADIIMTSLSLSEERARFVDFLQVISSSSTALYIRSLETEAYRWTTFFGPFSFSLWLGILAWVMLIAFILTLIETMVDESKKLWISCIENVWFGLAVNFGGKPVKIIGKVSHKVAMISILLGGTVMWIGYRSSLTSELSVAVRKLPFQNLEELSRSDYKLLVIQGVLLAYQLLEAPETTVFGNLRQNVLTEESFMPDEKVALETLIKEPNKALFSVDHTLQDFDEYKLCQIQLVWKPTYPNFPNSMAVRKQSFLKPFINNLVRKLKQTGTLEQIHQDNAPKRPNCNVGSRGKPLVLEKVFSLFFFLSVAILLSLFLLVLEHFSFKSDQQIPQKHLAAKEAEVQKCLQKIDELKSTILNQPWIKASPEFFDIFESLKEWYTEKTASSK